MLTTSRWDAEGLSESGIGGRRGELGSVDCLSVFLVHSSVVLNPRSASSVSWWWLLLMFKVSFEAGGGELFAG